MLTQVCLELPLDSSQDEWPYKMLCVYMLLINLFCFWFNFQSDLISDVQFSI